MKRLLSLGGRPAPPPSKGPPARWKAGDPPAPHQTSAGAKSAANRGPGFAPQPGQAAPPGAEGGGGGLFGGAGGAFDPGPRGAQQHRVVH